MAWFNGLGAYDARDLLSPGFDCRRYFRLSLSWMTNALGNVSNAVGSTAETVAQIAVTRIADPFSSIEESIRTAIPGNDPATLRDAAIAAVRAVVTGDPQQAAEGPVQSRSRCYEPTMF